jgi:hypothetical protein
MDRPGGRYFSNFISQDGSFGLPWVDQATVGAMELGMFDSSNGELPVTLIMSGAANYRLMSDLYDKIVSRGYRDLHAVKLPLYPESHHEMFAPSFADSVRILFH